MNFLSYDFFLLFLPVVVLGYWLLKGRRPRLMLLLLASWMFYAAWDVRFLGLLVLSSVIAYVASICVTRTPETVIKNLVLWSAIALNLCILGFFKYFNFFFDSAAVLLDPFLSDSSLHTLKVILPIGISFYTFQSISYVIDVYRRPEGIAPSFLELATYISFFPQLIAGPIVRYDMVRDQYKNLANITLRPNIIPAILFISVGVFEKGVLAESLGFLVDRIFLASNIGLVDGWLGALSFSFQIFFDFSGYSLIAVGLGHLFGLRLPRNFHRPYISSTFQEFWRRWHITLSTWYRDYLYVSLGGNRRGQMRTLMNVLLTMSLAGLWHGAAWTFVVWGVYHGSLLVIERVGGPLRPSWFGTRFAAVAVFLLVTIGWVPFRADSFSGASVVIQGMFGFGGILGNQVDWTDLNTMAAIIALFVGLLYLRYFPYPWDIDLEHFPRAKVVRLAVLSAAVFSLGFLTIPESRPFIYFQF